MISFNLNLGGLRHTAERSLALLPVFHAEIAHLGSAALHELTHGLCEHLAIGCVLEKIANLIGASESGLKASVYEHALPLGLLLAVIYLGHRMTTSAFRATEE
jgi:hypothetical protein